jgi:uncharacterized protein YbjT (DUF2867 family)
MMPRMPIGHTIGKGIRMLGTSDSRPKSRVILITGASGFVGTAVTQALLHHELKILARTPSATAPRRTTIVGDVTDATSLDGVCDGVDTLVHLVAIIQETGEASFDRVIRQGSENIFQEAKRAGVKHVVYISAIGAQDNPDFQYHQAKWRAEQALQASGLPHTILRPSIIYGPGDGFLSLLAGVVKSFPLTPVIGDGTSLFQPVHVQDVAQVVARAVGDPDAMPAGPMEIGGPDIFTFKELIELIRQELGVRRPKVHIPVPLMRTVVSLSAPLPKPIRPPVTMEQIKMLQLDNSTPDSWTERVLGRPATPLRGSLGYLRST